jgi:hypothetical protein
MSSDWQIGKGVISSNRHMLENEIACDVTFVVGPNKDRVRAHKYVLISRSPVFYAMFCGPLAESGGDIVIPDVDSRPFRTLLR